MWQLTAVHSQHVYDGILHFQPEKVFVDADGIKHFSLTMTISLVMTVTVLKGERQLFRSSSISTEEGKSSRMSTEYQSQEYHEGIRNITEFLDALEHGECANGEKTLSDRKEMPPEQANTNQTPVELGSSIFQLNLSSGGLSPLQVVQASNTIGPYIGPIVLYMHSHAMEAILQPERSIQVPKSDLEHNNGPAVLPVQGVQHHQDLISEDVKMGGTINCCSHPPILSTELHGEGRANSRVLQVEGTTLLGGSNGELDGSFSNSQQADCLLLDSSVFGQPEVGAFKRWMDGIIAESSTICPKDSGLLTEPPKDPPVCQMARKERGDCIPSMRDPLELNRTSPCNLNHISHTTRPAQGRKAHDFDLNQSLPRSPEKIRQIIRNSLYDQRYDGLPIDPILRMLSRWNGDCNAPCGCFHQ